ncbi:MAG: D-TA family PLP-dependent enzyme [Verrucomicrobiales bacterium]|nr:D-TA family PLP-dependent enzyme [Verrucomicrobiales bacterium]
MSETPTPWYRVDHPDDIDSPALLVYEERVVANLRRMVAQAGGVDRLRPHIKTHKLPQIVQWHLDLGITRFKAATIAEAEMCAVAGAPDVLLAYQPVGPRAGRLARLAASFPKTRFSTVVDDAEVARSLSEALGREGITLEVLIDLDCGQHRTGIAPGPAAVDLYRVLATLPGIRPGGLHAYDGHLHDKDPVERARRCEEAFAPVIALRSALVSAGFPVPRVVAGGTPTFPVHAKRTDVECSPGTCVFWDHGYGTNLPDLEYLPAAVLLMRVVSKPLPQRLCLDLGHKAVASEMPHPRVFFLNLPEAQFVGHNEEHLLVETPRAAEFPVGTVIYGIPWHVCPTVALHSEVVVIRGGKEVARWRVSGRDRRLSL